MTYPDHENFDLINGSKFVGGKIMLAVKKARLKDSN